MKTNDEKRRRNRSALSDAAKKDRFIAALESGCVIQSACRRASISSSDAYRWRREDLVFAGRWADAIEQAFDGLETTLLKTASLAPAGLPGAAACAMFLLKSRDPFRYCDRARALKLQSLMDTEREKKSFEEADAAALQSVLSALDRIAQEKRALAAPEKPSA